MSNVPSLTADACAKDAQGAIGPAEIALRARVASNGAALAGDKILIGSWGGSGEADEGQSADDADEMHFCWYVVVCGSFH